MALDLGQSFVSTQYPVKKIYRISPNFIYALTRSRLGLLPVIFLLIYNRVMVLDICQNFVPAQCL